MSIDEMIEILTAFKEGKEIEYYHNSGKKWILIGNNMFSAFNFGKENYRIKPELPKPEYVPFTLEDMELFANKLIKSGNNFYRIIGFNMSDITTQRSNYGYARALEIFTFAGGTPFGKIKP